jgi:hypothetical protein
MDILAKYQYEDGNKFSYSNYIKLAVLGWEIERKP